MIACYNEKKRHKESIMADSINPVSFKSPLTPADNIKDKKTDESKAANPPEGDSVTLQGAGASKRHISSKSSRTAETRREKPVEKESEELRTGAAQSSGASAEPEVKLESLAHTSKLLSIFLDECPAIGTESFSTANLPRVSVLVNENGEPLQVAKQGLNAPVFCLKADGEKGVFKPFVVDENPKTADLKRKETVYEIVSSHIMNEMGIPTITYYEAKGDVKGKELFGVVSDYVKNSSLAQNPTLLTEIKNPDETLRGLVFDAWIGNFDRILNNSNIWVKDGGEVIFGDYGCAFRKGVTAFGIPKANISVMNVHAKKEPIEKALGEIRSMSDEDIAALVDKGLTNTSMGDERIRNHMVGVLIRNRNELRETNPFEGFYTQNPVEIKLSEKASKDVAKIFIEKYGGKDPDPDQILDRLYENTYFKSPEAREKVKPLSDAIKHVMESYLKGESATLHVKPDCIDIFNAFINLTYCNFTPQKCLELNLGLYF
jgi:hypothetical protein